MNSDNCTQVKMNFFEALMYLNFPSQTKTQQIATQHPKTEILLQHGYVYFHEVGGSPVLHVDLFQVLREFICSCVIGWVCFQGSLVAIHLRTDGSHIRSAPGDLP